MELTVQDPRTGDTVVRVPIADASACDNAVARARAAFADWARTSPAERAAAVAAAAEDVRAAADELAALNERETGKRREDALGGVTAGAGTLTQYAELGPLHGGRSLQGDWAATDLMIPEPRGVVAVLTPWNDPVAVAAGLIGAALATGNTVVHKPSERCPRTGRRFAELVAAHLPAGVLEIVDGDGEVGARLARAPVDVVAHAGSTATGGSIAEAAARTGAHVLLENGGNDALVVDAGVDPEWAAAQAALGAFANAGQICTSVERIYLHQAGAEPFIAALEREARGWTIGPLIDARQRELVHGHVTDAAQRGAEVKCGGEIPDGPGWFYPPTVLVGGDADAPVLRDETFGPVAAVQVVPSFDQALELADRTHYGLAAPVLTKSPAHAQRAARELAVGTVKINAVFGGAPGGAAEPARLSGSGFGYGPELMGELTRTKVVHLAVAP